MPTIVCPRPPSKNIKQIVLRSNILRFHKKTYRAPYQVWTRINHCTVYRNVSVRYIRTTGGSCTMLYFGLIVRHHKTTKQLMCCDIDGTTIRGTHNPFFVLV